MRQAALAAITIALFATWSAPASAHEARTTAVFVDVRHDAVELERTIGGPNLVGALPAQLFEHGQIAVALLAAAALAATLAPRRVQRQRGQSRRSEAALPACRECDVDVG